MPVTIGDDVSIGHSVVMWIPSYKALIGNGRWFWILQKLAKTVSWAQHGLGADVSRKIANRSSPAKVVEMSDEEVEQLL